MDIAVFILLIASATLMTTIATYVWYKKSSGVASAFGAMSIVTSVWCWSQIVMQAGWTEWSRFIAHNVYFTCLVAVPPFWFSFALQYCRQRTMVRRERVIIALIPAISVALLWSEFLVNHNLLIAELDFWKFGFMSIPAWKFGPWYPVHTLYSYILIIAGIVLLLQFAVRLFSVHRSMAIALAMSALAPFLLSVILTIGIALGMEIPPLTTVGFIVSSVFWLWSISRQHFLDLVPIARDTLIYDMDSGMLVLDSQARIVDLNPAIQSFLCLSSDAIGQMIDTALHCQPDLFEYLHNPASDKIEVTIERNGVPRYYSLRTLALTDQQGRQNGQLIVAHDITDLKNLQRELHKRSEELEIDNALLIAELRTRLTQLQQAHRRNLYSREEERKRLARELHDGAIQLSIQIKQRIKEILQKDPREVQILDQSYADIDQLLEDLREVCASLRPPLLDEYGLIPAIRDEAAKIGKRYDLDIQVVHDKDLPNLLAETASSLYRIFQESLSNVVRHADAKNVAVWLRRDNSTIEMKVQDDGIGIENLDLDGFAATGHYGLLGVRERAESLGGELMIKTAPDSGTTLQVTIPMHSTREPDEYQGYHRR